MKSRLRIYNLNGKGTKCSRDLKHSKRDEVKDITWSNFSKIFQEKYIFEIFFQRKIKELNELNMGSLTIGFLYEYIFLRMINPPLVKCLLD